MKKLIELSEKIQDEKLRSMVVDFLENTTPSNKHFQKYPKMDIETATTPFSIGGLYVERDVMNHTVALVEACDRLAGVLSEIYGLDLNKDNLIAAAILHDIMKLYEWERINGEMEPTGILLDHTMLITSELYARGFPEEIIHLVASHFGDHGPTPPRSFEAVVMHHLDNMLSLIEYRVSAPKARAEQAVQMFMLDEDTISKLGEFSDIEKNTG